MIANATQLQFEAAEREVLGADFVNKIADETVGITEHEILPFLEEKTFCSQNGSIDVGKD